MAETAGYSEARLAQFQQVYEAAMAQARARGAAVTVSERSDAERARAWTGAIRALSMNRVQWDGPSMRLAAKALGIKHTRTSWVAFFRDVQVTPEWRPVRYSNAKGYALLLTDPDPPAIRHETGYSLVRWRRGIGAYKDGLLVPGDKRPSVLSAKRQIEQRALAEYAAKAALAGAGTAAGAEGEG